MNSTIWSLSPDVYGDPGLREFAVSKLVGFDERQRAAVVAFLEAVRELGDEHDRAEAETALAYWRS